MENMEKTVKIFDAKKVELENAYEEFEDFYNKMDAYFREKEVSQIEIKIVSEIKNIVDQLDKGKSGKGYRSWTGDDLTRADSRLAGFLFYIGELAAQKAQKANVSGRYIKWKRHNEWNSARQQLESELAQLDKDKQRRLIKEDIEVEVGKRIFAESVMEAMLSGHADLLMTIFDATKSVLTALAHRINLKRDERQLNRK